MLWIIIFANFWRKKIQNNFIDVGWRDLGKCGSWPPPIRLFPSFQYVNLKKYTSPEPFFVKIVKIDRYADKKTCQKNQKT